EGTFDGKPFKQTFAIDAKGEGELAARAWGEVAVASLLALNDPWVDGLVTAYCQQFNIASRSASFLILENEAEYKRFESDKEKKPRLERTALDKYLDDAWANLGTEASRKMALGRLLYGINPKAKVLDGPTGEPVRTMLALLDEKDCALPPAVLEGKLLKAS